MHDYQNPALTPERRAADLLARMTPAEKLAQLSGTRFDWGKERFPVSLQDGKLVKSKAYAELVRHGIGNIAHVNFSITVAESVAYVTALQQDLIKNTRLGIPAFILEECCHGQLAGEATVFPLPPGLAASFDPQLVQEVFTVIGRETRLRGGNMVASPNLDLGRDPRWGRVEETFGEDTHLTGQMGVAAVRGLQGDGDYAHFTAATPKHFAGYGQSAGGRQRGPAEVGERYFRDEILNAFRPAVEVGKALAIMPSYAEVDGTPCHGNAWLLRQVLRKEWGFNGIVGADFQGVNMLFSDHSVATDETEAARLALRAGVDLDWPLGTCFQRVYDSLEHDRELRDLVDSAVFRTLRVKFLLGLFENPYPDPEAVTVVHDAKAQAVALRAAERSLILLQNRNNLLPLDRNRKQRIALMGPHSRYLQFGGVSPHNRGVSILQGLQAHLSGSAVELRWAQGCVITNSDEVMPYLSDVSERHFLHLSADDFGAESIELINADMSKVALVPLEREASALDLAVQTARDSDLVILCLGESQSVTGEAVGIAHRRDRDSLELLGNQLELLRRVHALGKPIVVVLIHGRALCIDPVLELADAVIDAWNPGEARGTAIARCLFGELNPAGRLPVTLPRSVGQLPVHYAQKRAGWLAKYALSDNRNGLPFGHGLSYTTFTYERLSLSAERIAADETVQVTIRVRNSGDRDGDEVVQLYVQDEVASVSRPAWLLKAFQRVAIPAQQSRDIVLELGPEAFRFHNAQMQEIVEPGWFAIAVGPNSAEHALSARLQVICHRAGR